MARSLYRRREISVQKPDGTPIDEPVTTYVVREPGDTRPTSVEYAQYLLKGLREHDAPADYRAYVKQRICLSNAALGPEVEGL